MYYNLFIHSPTEGHPGCFQVLAVMNKALIKTHVQVFGWTESLTPLGSYQGAWLLEYMVSLWLVL